MQPEQQPLDIANSGCSQVAVVTTDSLPPAWNTQTTTQVLLPETTGRLRVAAGIQYPAVPKKSGKRQKGRKGVEVLRCRG